MIKSDDQAGFFMARDIPSSPDQASVWFHKKEGKTTVSSLIIPLSFFGLSYPLHIQYGKKRVKKRKSRLFSNLSSKSITNILFSYHTTCKGVDN